MGNNVGYNHYYRGEPPMEQLVCVMPKKYYDRVIALHHNCCSALADKRKGMMDLGPLNGTYDEERYDEETKGGRQPVDPDW